MIDAGDVVVSVLTGGRPELLAETLASTRRHHPGLLESAIVHVHWNMGDAETGAVLAAHWDVLDSVEVTDELWGIAASTNRLVERALATDAAYRINLQDDLFAHPDPGPWLDEARTLLDEGVAQVRLERHDAPHAGKHTLTGERFAWRPLGPHRIVEDFPFTFRPTLLRLADHRYAFPSTGEAGSIRRWHGEKFPRDTVQLVPGIWLHVGNHRDGMSLKFRNRRLNPSSFGWANVDKYVPAPGPARIVERKPDA